MLPPGYGYFVRVAEYFMNIDSPESLLSHVSRGLEWRLHQRLFTKFWHACCGQMKNGYELYRALPGEEGI